MEHVKAHRTEKDKKEMSHFERFVTDGSEKADELSKECAMWDEELKPQAKENWIFLDNEREETKHRTEWCAGTSRYRCMKSERKIRGEESTEEVQRSSNDERSSWSREVLVKTRMLLREEASEDAGRFPQRRMRQNNGEQDQQQQMQQHQ